MVKLLITDVDGTLIGANDTAVSEEIKKLLRSAIASSCHIAIASGRTYSSLIGLFGELAESAYFIPCDGALCIKNGKTLYHRPISSENVRKAFIAAKEHGLGLHLASSDHGYAFGGKDFESKLTNEHTESFKSVSSHSDIKAPIYKIAFYGKNPNFAVIPADLRCSYKGNGWHEYVYRYTDKGAALSDLQSRLYLGKYDTAAMGDGTNDITMLKGAKYAFSLSENAVTEGSRSVPSAKAALEMILALIKQGASKG